MKQINFAFFFSVLLLTSLSASASAQIVFSKQVLPLLKTQCWSCHSGSAPASGYSMEMRNKLISGGRHGAAVIPGKGAKSPLILYMTGELKPKMPPNGAIDLEKIAILRRWIDEGAKVDGMAMPLPLAPNRGATGSYSPVLKVQKQSAPITSLSYSPDGSLLAVAGYQSVRLVNPADGTVTRTLSGCAGQTQALAFSSDGKRLAVAGGVPGKSGEIAIFDAQTWKLIRTLTGHAEVVYAVDWKPNSMELASGSLDKTARIWDVATGQSVRIIKDHADSVFGIAYSPDGKLLATGSADRSVKLFDTASWKRVASLTAHQDGVTHVAFNHKGSLLASVGTDKTMRLWKVEIGKMENPLRTQGEGDIINSCAFSPDDSLFVWAASNRTVKAFNADAANQLREFKEAEDWVYCVAVGKDNQTIVAGTQDGKLLFWNQKEGKLFRTLSFNAEAPLAPKLTGVKK